MNSLFLLIPIAFVLVAIAIRLFIWAVRNGQYDDLNTEGKRILFDDDTRSSGEQKKPQHDPSRKSAENQER